MVDLLFLLPAAAEQAVLKPMEVDMGKKREALEARVAQLEDAVSSLEKRIGFLGPLYSECTLLGMPERVDFGTGCSRNPLPTVDRHMNGGSFCSN